jgi:hypothetical protein
MAQKPITAKPVSVTTYLLISGVSLIAAVIVGYYYFHSLKQAGNEKMDDRVFYLVLILFGIAASALIFGIMNSYASLKGIQSSVTYKFTGPIVGVILTVLGGFMLPKGTSDQILSIRVFNEDNHPVTRGTVTITFPHYQRSSAINNDGLVVFPDIPEDQLRNDIIINVVSDGYDNVTLDTLLSGFSPVKITLNQAKVIRLAGTVKDAADRPIRDVEVQVDGTPYAARTTNDGSFEIPIPGYHFGDRVTLVTSHSSYEDKSKIFEIESGEIDHIEFVLNPVPLNNPKSSQK